MLRLLSAALMEPKWKQLLYDWALANSFVVRLWVFGSRAKGTHHPGSDLDVAIHMESSRRHESAYVKFLCEYELWQNDLQILLDQTSCPVRIHLCLYDSDIDPELSEAEGNIVKAVQAGSILIYDSTASPIENP